MKVWTKFNIIRKSLKNLWKLVKNGYINLVQICTNLYTLILVSILMYLLIG